MQLEVQHLDAHIECWEHKPKKSKICDFEILSPINSVLANCHGGGKKITLEDGDVI